MAGMELFTGIQWRDMFSIPHGQCEHVGQTHAGNYSKRGSSYKGSYRLISRMKADTANETRPQGLHCPAKVSSLK